MTVGIGLYTKTGVALLADRRTSFGSEIVEQCKIRKAGKYHYVAAGFSAIRDVFDDLLPKLNGGMWFLRSKADLTSWHANTGEGGPFTVDIAALVTDGKTLWRVGGDFIAYEILTPFAAIGSGGAAALGAMHAGASAEKAIEIACKLCSHCGNGTDRVDVKRRGR